MERLYICRKTLTDMLMSEVLILNNYRLSEGFLLFAICFLLYINTAAIAEELPQSTGTKHPDYACMYLDEDRCENFNRKIFKFNTVLNKVIIKPVDIIWASIMPKYGMDRIRGVYKNIEYPKRLVSTLVQGDFKASGRETARFLANSTIGIGGMFDPAKRFFKLEPADENMEQALTKCKCRQGHYMVIPGINSTTPRGLCGKLLDTALNPTSYIGTPVLALIKLGFTVNETTYMQAMADMVQSNFADPYDIAKKYYGIETHIKANNYDRQSVIEENEQKYNSESNTVINSEETKLANTPSEEDPDVENVSYADLLKDGITKESYILKHSKPKADIVLENYNPQTPVIDAMRTALFNLPGINDSIWTDLSIWNRSYAHRLKTSSINIEQDRENYKYRYILNKNKTAPLAIIFPSIGEGIKSHHSVVFSKMFYDEGYSVIILGSSFQWEFVKSVTDGYTPGIPAEDAKILAKIIKLALSQLEEKYKYTPKNKTIIGTSFGALTALFVASNEYKNDTLGTVNYIAINPPIELFYAMKEVDKNCEEWQKNTSDLKERVAHTSAKILKLWQQKDEPNFTITQLPFSDSEAKIITSYIMHQKLSDLIHTIEKVPTHKSSEFYQNIYNVNYQDYMNKYLLENKNLKYDDLNYDSSLYSISDYLENSNNYKIYHALDDYLINSHQLNMLKKYTGNKSVYLNNGSHLGFMYRPEFIDSLSKDIKINKQ